jgi:DNA repair exonuclease SbcCD nuclease subunit
MSNANVYPSVKVPSRGAKVVPVNLSNENEEFIIVAAGDFHVGADAFNTSAFENFLKQITTEAKKKKVFIILMGDLFDSIHFGDKRYAVNSTIATMDESLAYLTSRLKPLISNPNITFVGSIAGNHELKYCKGDVNPIHQLYANTGITPLGSYCSIYFDLMVKKTKIATLRTVAFHGKKSASNAAGRIKVAREFLRDHGGTYDEFVRETHIAFYGHTHGTMVSKEEVQIDDVRNKKCYTKVQWCCCTGSFFDTANHSTNSYAADSGLPPLTIGYVKASVSLNDLNLEAVTDGLTDVKKIGWWNQ